LRQDINIFKAEYKGDCDIAMPFKPLMLRDTLESDDLIVEFSHFSKDASEVTFMLTDKASKEHNNVTIGLQWWSSCISCKGGH
jgi:hypothetical protein